MKNIFANRRGLVQLFIVTVLPFSVLLLVVAFGSVAIHEQDMRALVGDRDERAVRSAAAALEAELHHRAATIALLSYALDENPNSDLLSDFDGGLAYFDSQGKLIKSTAQPDLWHWLAKNKNDFALASAAQPEVVFSKPLLDPASKKFFVIVSVYSSARGELIVGAFTPASLAANTLSSIYPAQSHATIFLMDSSRRILYAGGMLAPESLPADHPGVAEALRGESGSKYVVMSGMEHIVAYSPIPTTGWALITQENWHDAGGRSLQITQWTPLILVPVLLFAFFALWFIARQIIQPLQKLESKSVALASGDFESIEESVGGISEIERLQTEMAAMARKVQAAQAGLHDYIEVITSAQEDERLRLAHELHDETIQSVIALKQRIQLAEKSARGKQSLRELETLAEQTIDNLRRIIRALRPIYLEDLGLVAALEMLARETKSGQVEFACSGNQQRLTPQVELTLYRIAQEALSNVARHAQTERAKLEINFGAHEVKLQISDEGVGFVVPASPTDFAPSGHFGLLGIKERCELIGGKLEIKSAARSGTQIVVRVPLT